MMTDVTIRSATPKDFQSLSEVYERSIKSNPHGFIQDLSFHGCLIKKIKLWRMGGGDVLVAAFGAKVVGLGALAPQNERGAELCKLHVDRECQGRGIGRLIATDLIECARKSGFSHVELHVTATQKAAIRLYRRLSFRETGRKLFKATVFGAEALFDTIYMSLTLADSTDRAQD